jgi:hypothetical protein
MPRASCLVFAAPLLAALLTLVGCATAPPTPTAPAAVTAAYLNDAARPPAAQWLRSELYIAVGGADDQPSAETAAYSEATWRAFLDESVTPLFPDGLTVFDAYGQWLNRDRDTPGRLRTKVIVILHEDTPAARAKIDAVRLAWKTKTGQLSVLLATHPVEVSF